MQRRRSVCFQPCVQDSRRVIVVSYRVPNSIGTLFKETQNLNCSVLHAVRALCKSGRDVVWIGYPRNDIRRSTGSSDENGSSEQEEFQEQSLLENLKLISVELNQSVAQVHLRDFCKGVLWPLFHYYGHGSATYATESWDGYCSVNLQFAKAILSVYQPGDYIIIHDYHLMMVPHYLRLHIASKIGFFFHTPWPSSELYRSLPVRDRVLQSLVRCDVIGFQTFSFMNHFMSACTRILGLTASEKGIECEDGHFVTTEVNPSGIDPDYVSNFLKKESVVSRKAELRKMYGNKKLIVSIDSMEYINGIPQKLMAYELFLRNFPEWKGKAVLIQLCRPNADAVMESRPYKELREQIDQLVGAINGQFGNVSYFPVVYLNQSLSLEEIFALYSIADVALVTPLRDGMNLSAFEYIMSQHEKMNPLILSEFAGAARCLGGAILVNPWHWKKVSKVINEALSMSDDLKGLRHYYNNDYVTKHTAEYWILQFLKTLQSCISYRFEEAPHLPLNQLLDSYLHSHKRMFFLDYDGTLTPKKRLPQEAVPSTETLAILRGLADDLRNCVYIVSGRDRKFLEEYFAGIRVGLAAEHGNFIRKPPRHGEEGDFIWEEKSSHIDMRWKQDVMKIFTGVTDVTPGSFVEEKEINLTWHYRNADPEFAEWQMREMLVYLQGLPKSPIDILVGSKNVEVRPQGVNKGTLVRGIMVQEHDVDFAICLGDDKTDEDMFQEMKQYDVKYMFTATVEKKPTTAMFYLESQRDVLDVLNKILDITPQRR